jgi:hypothetical protein
MEGLMKWVGREGWRDTFDEVFQHHVGEACRGAGMGLDELAEIIGNHGVSNLWGCAFEDFVSLGPDQRNVAVDYLKRRGWKESAGTRAYIEALRRSTMSLYEVSGIVAGESFLARDMIRGGEPVRVFERSATRGLKQWDRIAARIVTVLGKTQITGALLIFDHQLADEALASIKSLRKMGRAKAGTKARSPGQAKGEDAQAATTVDEVLAGAAFMFSTFWLCDVLRQALNPSLPEMQNIDGEPLEFITLHYPLQSKAKLAAIRSAFDALPALRKEDDSFWNWLETEKTARQAPARKSAAVRTFSTTMDDGATVLGNVEITAKAVTLSVNSQGRAARGQAMLDAALAGFVRTPLIERQTVEQMISRSPRRPTGSSEPPPLPPDEMKRIVHQGMTDHYRRTLDEPIPALGNRLPRQAVKTARGKDKVIAWLKMLENSTGRRDPDDPMASYDFTWMWDELGLSEHRR